MKLERFTATPLEFDHFYYQVLQASDKLCKNLTTIICTF